MSLVDEIKKYLNSYLRKAEQQRDKKQMLEMAKIMSNTINKQVKDFKTSKDLYCEDFEQYIQFIKNKIIMEDVELGENIESELKITIYSLCEKIDTSDELKNTISISMTSFFLTEILTSYVEAADIIEVYGKTQSWEKVDNLIKNRDKESYSFKELAKVMLKYADTGIDFIDRYYPEIKEEDIYAKLYNIRLSLQVNDENGLLSQ